MIGGVNIKRHQELLAMVAKTVLHDLNSGMVLDRSVLVELPSTDMSQIIASIRAAGHKPLHVVDGAEAFFTPGTLVSLIAAKDKRYTVVNEALGGFFTDGQIAALINPPGVKFGEFGEPAVIKPAAAAQGDLIIDLGAQQQAAGPYVFAQVPTGWSMSANMSLGPTRIKRKIKNSDGDGTLFFMSPQDFEKLWMFASKAWCGVEGAPLQASFNTGQGKLKATVQDDRISLGGNYVRRYEIEQVAKYRGWELPQLQAA